MDVGQVEEGLVESDVKLLLHPAHKGVVSEYTINVVRMSNECLTNLVHNVFLNVLRMSCKFLMNFRQMSVQTSYKRLMNFYGCLMNFSLMSNKTCC